MLRDPTDGSTPGLPVHHQLPEFTQTHVHGVGDAIQPSHPLSSPSPPTFNLSQHQGLFKSQFFTSGGQCWNFSFSIMWCPHGVFPRDSICAWKVDPGSPHCDPASLRGAQRPVTVWMDGAPGPGAPRCDLSLRTTERSPLHLAQRHSQWRARDISCPSPPYTDARSVEGTWSKLSLST